MARRKTVPMKSHTIRMTDEEWTEMQRCAEIADESDSEYIRKAVSTRNFMIKAANEQVMPQPMTAKYRLEHAAEDRKETIEADKKQIKSPMVNTFMKGEKK